MKPPKFKYIAPSTLDEALHYLGSEPDAKVLSGGQSLMPLLAMRLATPSLLVDLQHVPDLSRIQEEGDRIHIGARATHSAVERSVLVANRVPILHAAARHIAHPQIRSRGTFGGSTAHADPSGEWPAVLLSLGAAIHVCGPQGSRTIEADSFFTGPFLTSMKDTEILTHVSIPTTRSAWAFQEAARKAGDYGLALIAITGIMQDRALADPRVSVGAAVGSVTRLTAVEELLAGAALAPELAEQAEHVAMNAVTPISDIHGSTEFRRRLVGNLVRRAVMDLQNGVAR